jgi:hypothetical protein
MPLVRGTTTADRRVPASNTYTLSHNHNAGADGYLFVVIASPGGSIGTVNTVTYGGVAMTLVQRRTNSNYQTDWTVWRLAAPATGANNLVVRTSSAQFNGVSTFITSYTGCAGVGNTAYNGTNSNPVTTSVTIQQNSMIIGAAIGGNQFNQVLQIPTGTALTFLYNHNINNYTWGAVTPSLGAGTISCRAGGNGGSIIMVTEVREAAEAPVTNNTSGWWMILN